MKSQTPHPVDELLPIRRLIPLGLQHVMVMVATPLSAVFLVSKSLGLSESLTANLMSATFVLCGLGSLLQSLGPWKVGARLPFVMLPGGAPIIMFLTIATQHNLATAVGAVLLTGGFYFVMLPLFRRLLRFFPTVVIGTMIVVIGVNLVQVSAMLITGQPGAPGFANAANLGLGMATIALILAAYLFLPKALRQVAVLVGLLAGTGLAAAVGMAHFEGAGAGSIIALPQLLPFGAPTFDFVAALPLLIFSVASMAEATGQTVLNAEIVGRKIEMDKASARTIRGDAIMSLMGGLFGTSLIVTSGENIGIVQITGVRSRFVTAAAGIMLITIGLLAPLGRIMAGIPAPVVGGTAVFVFTIIIAMGFRMLARVDYAEHRNTIIIAAALAAGLMPILVPGIYGQLTPNLRILLGSGVAMTAFVGVVMNVLLNHLRRQPLQAGDPDPSPDPAEVPAPEDSEQTLPAPAPRLEGTR